MLNKIQDDMRAAMKSGDKLKVSTLRMVLSDLHNLEKEKNVGKEKKEELTEEDIISIIQRSIKRRKEAIELYQKGEREELAEKEKKEIEILNTYLPEALSPEEMEKKVEEIIAELNATDQKHMGLVMKEMMNRYKGRVDGSQVKEIVLKKLKR
jgi:uncharacterized protein YqeY